MKRRIGLIASFALSILILICLTLFLSSKTQATSPKVEIIHVPSQYPTIQQAINASTAGDTILVAPGTYPENINFLTKNITLTSELGPEVTIIDGGQQDSVVYIGPSGRLIGFKIINGIGVGGGVNVSGTGTRIIGNIFDGNQQEGGYFGAGVGGNGASPVIEGNIFIHNRCDNQHLSGVISFVNMSSPRISNNIFIDNLCRAINLTLPTGNSPQVINNTIVSNTVGIKVDARVYTGMQIYRNNIIQGNDIGLLVENGSPPDYPSWEYNLVYNNASNYQGIPDQTGLNGNISEDPLFIDPSFGLLNIEPNSPIIDAGTNIDCPSGDIRGVPRPQGIACDMGAYEASMAVSKIATGDFNPGGTITYTITIHNQIQSAFSSLTLSDTLPAHLSYITGTLSASNGVVGETNGVITWTGSVFTTTNTLIGFSTQISEDAPRGIPIINTANIDWGLGSISAESIIVTSFSKQYLPISPDDVCLDFFDDYSNPNSGWSIEDDDFARSEYLNGEYRILTKQGGYIYLYTAPACGRENFVLEVDARWVGTPGESYGLIFGVASDFSHYYLFDINTDYQEFRLLYRGPSGFDVIVPIMSSPAINAENASNHLKVIRNGNQITLVVNGFELGTWVDDRIVGLYNIGILTNPYNDTPISDARFDNFSVVSLPEATIQANQTDIGGSLSGSINQRLREDLRYLDSDMPGKLFR